MEENNLKLIEVGFDFENCDTVIIPSTNFSQLVLNNTDILQSNYNIVETIHNIITTGNIVFKDNHNLHYVGGELKRTNPLDRFIKINDLVSINLFYENSTITRVIKLKIKCYYEDEDNYYESHYENKNVIITSPNYYTISIKIQPYIQIYMLNDLLSNQNQYIGNEFEDIMTKDRYIFSDINELNIPILMPILNRCKYNFSSGKYIRINCYNLFNVQYDLIKIKKVDFAKFVDYINIIDMNILELTLKNKIKVQPNTIYYTMDNDLDYVIIGEYNEMKLWLQSVYELGIEDLYEWCIK